MKITWVVRSFLDYRIPIYKMLSECKDVEFTLITSDNPHINPPSVLAKARQTLGNKLITMSGEKRLGSPSNKDNPYNKKCRIYFQPGIIDQINRTEPDIIITDAFNHWTIPALWLRFRSRKIRHIVCYERTAHNERYAPYLKRKYIGFVSRWIDAVHCNGILCKNFLQTLGYPERKLKLGNMAADNTFFENATSIPPEEREQLRKQLGLKGVTYVYSGRLIPLKGLRELLNVWEQFSEDKAGDVSLMLIGSGPLQEELEDICRKKGLDNVHILGRIDYSLLPPYYHAADCFLIPTLDDNWSLVVPEAMATGLPILCSKYNGCHPELVRPENGWVFDPKDSQNFREVLQRSYQERRELPEMGAASTKIVKEYSPEVIVRGIYDTCLNLYKTL